MMQPDASAFIMEQSQLAIVDALFFTQTRMREGTVDLGPNEGWLRHSQ